MTAAPPPPRPGTSPGPVPHSTATPGPALARVVLALALAAVLTTDHLVAKAEQLPFGPRRDAALFVAELADAEAARYGLDEPAQVLASATGRSIGRPEPQPSSPTGPGSGGDGIDVAAPETGTGAGAGDTVILTDRASSAPSATGAGPSPVGGGGLEPDLLGPPVPEQALSATDGRGDGHPGDDPRFGPPGQIDRRVDPTDPLRIWAGGDSLGEFVGNQLLDPVADPDLTRIDLGFHISTGLARPDYFDWPAELATVMGGAEPPEVLVFMVGGNDDQPMQNDGAVFPVGSDGWRAEYRRRVMTMMDLSHSGTSHLYWIGLPPMRDVDREEISTEINQILAEEADLRPWVTYVDIHPLFSAPEGGYSSTLVDPDGQSQVVRAPDGVHITYVGSEWVTEQVWAAVSDQWGLDQVMWGTWGTGPATPR